MGRFEHLIERTVSSDVRSRLRVGPILSKWNAAPLGRLGRELLADIETYLEFFEIACADVAHDRTSPAR